MPLDVFTLPDNRQLAQHYNYIKNRADGAGAPVRKTYRVTWLQTYVLQILTFLESGLSIPYTVFSNYTLISRFYVMLGTKLSDFGKKSRPGHFKLILC